ncbi:MAG: histidine phosphatase family protein [Kiritimatiellae bacterium]|nr:histidine phosphatase family protein [Kiritimatiellia bacterium]MDW8457854.1 histidine phosphatase family protein [Verrucomicrobiota bacterium]
MRILFIRHAEAVDATEFAGDDLERPLTPAGRKRFGKVVAYLARNYPKPECILSSKAVRAWETANDYARGVGVKDIVVRDELNPGATPDDIRQILKEYKDLEWIALVGHEPDFSKAIAALTSRGKLRMKFKKGAVAEVEWSGRGDATLRALIDPARL